MVSLGALEPGELVLLTVAIVGLVPVILRYTDEAKWFTLGYCCLVVGAVATNVEALVLGDVFNFVEHAFGLLGSGVAFAYAAYDRRERLSAAEEAGLGGSETLGGSDAVEG
ncbi:hypothetical protein [Halobellus rubicundus]|uniref:Uncharacterized protein n=1 Tax=Halobellus rubicundus TaxID=2996466 RepID=A0ABD5MDG4_9EURY